MPSYQLKRPIWIALSLGVLILVTFWRVGDCQFINVDDPAFVAANPHIQNGLTWHALKWATTADLFEDSPNADYWQPVTMISHAAVFQLFGDDPRMHHAANLVGHLAVALLLFHVLRRMTGSLWRSAMVSALFALHPTRVESVAWVTERKDMLSALFWVLTMWAYWHYTRRPGWKRYVLVALGFALGLMSKPMVLTLPCVLLLLDFWPLKRLTLDGGGGGLWRARLFEKVPLVLMAIASAWITAQFQPGAMQDRSPARLFLKALASYAAAISHQVLPIQLSSQYPREPFSPGDGVLDLAILAVLILAVRLAFSRPWLLMGWLWFLGTLTPVLFLNDIVTADRFSYIPCIGLFIVVSWGGAELVSRWHWPRPLTIGVTAAALLILILLTRREILFWKDSEALARRGLEINPDEPVAHYTLGTALVNRGSNEEAIPHLERALVLRSPMTLNNLGTALAKAGRADLARESYQRATALDPRYVPVHYNLGTLLRQLGQGDEALAEFQKAVAIDPRHVLAWDSMGNLLRDRGRVVEAIACYRSALEADPQFDKAHNNLAICLAHEGRLDEAIQHHREAIRISPREALWHCNLGGILVRQGRWDDAIACYQEALRLQPDMKRAQTGLEGVRKSRR